MKLSFQALGTIKYFLSYTGEKEIGAKGEEVLSSRRLNNEEACQRRFFLKNTEDIFAKDAEERKVIIDEYNEKLNKKKEGIKKENPKKAKEEGDTYDKRIDDIVSKDGELIAAVKIVTTQVALKNKAECEFVLEDKTKEVVKKFFKEYADKIGWATGDDEVVSELQENLG